jgi:hypothetical protein
LRPASGDKVSSSVLNQHSTLAEGTNIQGTMKIIRRNIMTNIVSIIIIAMLTASVLEISLTAKAQTALGQKTGEGGVFQALKQEKDGAINLGNFDGSQILDARGNVLTTITIKKWQIRFVQGYQPNP